MDENRGRSSNGLSEEEMGLRRGPWTVDEDLTLINYIATHGEGRWNTLALSAGLKRTGKSCRLRWLNYLRPDVRRGNITLEEQLLILELHSRWGNRWSKIAQYLPGRTDNEIKNYWRTRVQKHAKQLKCDVNSKQFKDTVRYLWMPRLLERIQAAAAGSTATTTTTTTVAATTTTIATTRDACTHGNNTFEVHNHNHKMGLTPSEIVGSQHVTQSYTPENSNTASSSSDSFGTHVSNFSDMTDYYSVTIGNNCADYYQSSQISYSDCITSPSGLFPHQGRLDFQSLEPNNSWNMQSGDSSDNFWNVESMLFLEQQLMNDNM